MQFNRNGYARQNYGSYNVNNNNWRSQQQNNANSSNFNRQQRVQNIPQAQQNNQSQDNNTFMGQIRSYGDQKSYGNCVVNNIDALTLFDTGADVSLIKKSLVDESKIDNFGNKILTTLGGDFQSHGTIEVGIEIGQLSTKVIAHVIDDLLIGNGFLLSKKMEVCYTQKLFASQR